MTQVGYQESSEKTWWWKVAMHLDEAQLALANAMAHNLDDQRLVFALQDKLREGQAMLLKIFRGKGLIPVAANGAHEEPPMSGPAVPDEMIADADLVDQPFVSPPPNPTTLGDVWTGTTRPPSTDIAEVLGADESGPAADASSTEGQAEDPAAQTAVPVDAEPASETLAAEGGAGE